MNMRSWVRKLFDRRTTSPIRKTQARGRLTVEGLEDRTLLDSRLFYQAVANTPLTLLQAGNELRVVDSNNFSNVLASELLANLTDGVLIVGDRFDVNLTIDGTVPTVPNGVVFDGGTGIDQLVGPNAAHTWHVTGAGSGDLSGASFVRFSGVENLTGAAGNEDTFVLAPAARLGGVIDGGSGGYDRLVLDDGTSRVTYAPTGSQDGTVAPGGASFSYRGLEPYRFNLSDFSDARNVTIAGNPLVANDLSVTRYAATGLLLVNPGNPADSFAFSKPADSLTVVMGGLGNNTLSVGSPGATLVLPGALTIRGGGFDDRVVLAGALTLSHGGLSVDGATGNSEVILNDALNITDGGLTIDDRLGLGQSVRLNAPVTVGGDVSIRGGVLADTVALNATLDITGTLTIDGTVSDVDKLLGLDDVTLNGNVNTHGGKISIDAGTISVGPVALSTRHFDLANPAKDIGDGGDIAFDAQTIAIGPGGQLLATADPAGQFKAGAVTLTAFVRDLSGVLPIDVLPSADPSITVGPGAVIRGGEISLKSHKTSQSPLLPFSLLSLQRKKATVTIAGATIAGSGVKISAEAEDANALEDDQYNLANNLSVQAFLTNFDIPALLGLPPIISAVSVQKRGADALVSLTDSNISSTGDIDIGATVDVTSNAQAAGGYDARANKPIKPLEIVPFSAGYSRAEGSAQTLIGGNTRIDAADSVTITSDATTSATVTAFTAANGLFGNNRKVSGSKSSFPAIAIAVTESDTTSKAVVGRGVQITAGGNVTVHANADVTNQARSGTAVFGDGLGSVGVAMGSDTTNVLSRVDGHITAGGTAVNPVNLSQVDDLLNTITLPDHGLVDGQVIVYHAVDPMDLSSNPTVLTPIGGLIDGASYRVIVKDKDTIQLAEAPSITLDASGLDADVRNTLSRRAVKSTPGTAIDTVTDTITLAGHGFSELQTVTLATDSGWTIEGLAPQGDYLIHVADAGHIQLLTSVEENAGATLRRLAGTNYFIVDLTIPASATPQGSLYLGYNEMPLEFNAAAAVQGNTLEIAGHGLQTGDIVTYGVLQNAQPDKVAISRTALFSPADFVLTFNPNATATSVADNTIHLPGGHNFITGQRVNYSAGGGTPIGGLSDGGTYYIIVADIDRIQLAATQAAALDGHAVPLTSGGTGTTHHLRGGAVDTEGNQLEHFQFLPGEYPECRK